MAPPRSRNRRTKGSRNSSNNRQISVLKDIKQELVTQNIKDSKSLTESVPDVPRIHLKRNKVYTFSRKFRMGAITATAVTGASGAFSFSMSQLPNGSDIYNLFDQYMISQITVTILPNAVSTNVPVYTAFDYDDDLTPPSLLTVFEKDTCRLSNSDQVIQRTFTPRTLREVYATVASSGYETSTHTWIDSQNDVVKHYGFKYYIAQIPVTGQNIYECNVEFIFSCRSPT